MYQGPAGRYRVLLSAEMPRQIRRPVSDSSAKPPFAAAVYITPPTTRGIASEPDLPVRKVHARCKPVNVAVVDLRERREPRRAGVVSAYRPVRLGEEGGPRPPPAMLSGTSSLFLYRGRFRMHPWRAVRAAQQTIGFLVVDYPVLDRIPVQRAADLH